MDLESDKESTVASDEEGINAERDNSLEGMEIVTIPKQSRLNSNIVETEANSLSNLEMTVKEENKDGTVNFNESLYNSIVFVDVQIGSKLIENVPVRYGCKVDDIGEELAANESVKVVYYLYEKLQKGARPSNCDASNAQVLFKLSPKWKWIPIKDLIDDATLPIGDAFSDVMPHFRLTFSLVPRLEDLESMSEEEDEQPTVQDQKLIEELTDLLSQHTDSELISRECPLSQALLTRLHEDQSLPEMSQEELESLHKWIKTFKAKKTKTDKPATTKPAKVIKRVCDGTSDDENKSWTLEAPLSRYRVTFDPVTERPQLREWYKKESFPSKSTIERYVNELNSRTYRVDKNLVTVRAVYIWFKNTRARGGIKEK